MQFVQRQLSYELACVDTWNPIKAWEMLKCRAKKIFQRLARNVVSEEHIVISELIEKVDLLQEAMPLNERDMKMYLDHKAGFNGQISATCEGNNFQK